MGVRKRRGDHLNWYDVSREKRNILEADTEESLFPGNSLCANKKAHPWNHCNAITSLPPLQP